MGEFLDKLEPHRLWYHFEKLCNTPRPSKNEAKVIHLLERFATKNNLQYDKDEVGNVIIRKPATPGYENRVKVLLQGHVDMVCEKNREVEHDFDNDAILPYIDGDWVRAKGTTLGADNGIGVAAALAVLEAKDLEHGPIEALFTIDEETGLNGALGLKSSFTDAKIMLNLDSEEDGAFYIGCSGGKNTYGDFVFDQVDVPAGSAALQLKVTGLKGGHSGLDIHTGRGNAIKILSRLLWNLNKAYDLGLCCIEGGSKHNAIPRESIAVITVPASQKEAVEKEVVEFNAILKKEFASLEHDLKISAHESPMPPKLLKPEQVEKFLNCLYAMPHGVYKMSPDIDGLVETSTNLATVVSDGAKINVGTSQRSSVESENDDIVNKVAAVFALGGASVQFADGYPGWAPNIHSDILKVCKKVYKDAYKAEPEVKAIHAGLECGIIGERFPQMDMISFGPTIMGAHSPDERVQVSTVGKFWDLLKHVLKNIPEAK